MRHLKITCCCMVFYSMIMAQKTDTAYINASNTHAFALHETTGDSVLQKCFELLQQSRLTGYLKGQGDACVTIGCIYQYRDNFVKSDNFFNAALQIRRQIGDSIRVAAVLLNLGVNRSLQTQYDAAIENTLRAIYILETVQNSDLKLLGGAYLELSSIFDEYLEPEEALRYARKSLQTYIKINKPEIVGKAAYALGNRFHEKGSLDSSLFYYNLALTISWHPPKTRPTLPIF